MLSKRQRSTDPESANPQTMSSPIIESAAYWTGVVTVVATALAALTGSLSWYFSHKVSISKEAELSRFQTESRLAIAEAEARAAEANEKAEQERLARVRLAESLAPRRLTKEQQAKLTSKLGGFDKQPISFWYAAGDSEAKTFTWEIADAVDAAEWHVFSPASTVALSASGKAMSEAPSIETGVTVISTRHESCQLAAQTLAKALNDLGFDATKREKIEARDAPGVIVNVEVRPEGPQGVAKLRVQKQ